MSNKSRKNIELILYFSGFFIISFYLIKFKLIKYDFFIETEFLFTFISVFIGFSITLYTYITSIFDKVIDKINIKYHKDEIEKKVKLDLLVIVHSGIRDDINFMIGGLLTVIIIALGQYKINYLSIEYPIISELSSSILLTIFFLTILAIRDLIKVAFIFSDFLAKPNVSDESINKEKEGGGK